MIFIDKSKIPIRFKKGASSLVLGKREDVEDYMMDVFDRYNFGTYAVHWACTYPADWIEDEDMETAEFVVQTDENLLPPEEMFKLAIRDCNQLKSKIIYVPGITRSLVQSYGAQYKINYEFMLTEVPCWLTEYAIYAAAIAERRQFDIFLNLDWDIPKNKLPSSFLSTFDRVYECGEIGGEKAIYKTKDILSRFERKAAARGRNRHRYKPND